MSKTSASVVATHAARWDDESSPDTSAWQYAESLLAEIRDAAANDGSPRHARQVLETRLNVLPEHERHVVARHLRVLSAERQAAAAQAHSEAFVLAAKAARNADAETEAFGIVATVLR